jgi:hypothetical protein
MKITKIDTSRLRNDAHSQFLAEFRDLIAAHGAEALKIKPQFQAFLPLYNNVDEALKKIVKSALTAKIHDADLARDDTFAGLLDVCRGMCRHFTPAVKDAALKVQIVLDTYGNVAGKSLNEETSAIYNLVQELQDKHPEDLAATGLAEWVAELKTRNNAFEALVKERFDETARKTDVVLRDARKAADEAYKKICDIINVYVLLEGEANYADFIKTLNAVIAKYALMIHHHHRNHHSGGNGNNNGVGAENLQPLQPQTTTEVQQ